MRDRHARRVDGSPRPQQCHACASVMCGSLARRIVASASAMTRANRGARSCIWLGKQRPEASCRCHLAGATHFAVEDALHPTERGAAGWPIRRASVRSACARGVSRHGCHTLESLRNRLLLCTLQYCDKRAQLDLTPKPVGPCPSDRPDPYRHRFEEHPQAISASESRTKIVFNQDKTSTTTLPDVPQPYERRVRTTLCHRLSDTALFALSPRSVRAVFSTVVVDKPAHRSG